LEWYRAPHGWTDRAAIYRENALNLIESAARQAIENAHIGVDDIDALVTVSSTGVAVPSLDASLANRIGLKANIERLPIFGLGCAGGVAGLARASRMARTFPGGHVLVVAVELCALNFRLADSTKAMFVSSALFGDGAAALVIRPAPQFGNNTKTASGRIVAFGEHMWPDTEYIMGWSVEEDGLGVVISTEIPSFARNKLLAPIKAFLKGLGLTLSDLDGVVLHPGGRRVIEAFEAATNMNERQLKHARSVLRDYGNMSSPTVLFVLERTLQSGASGKHLMIALGPGFTVSFALLEL
jgi:alkylresorcinol/alkylpyrone synthase